MARQSDADLIRAITGGISQIGQLFQPTQAELQSQRITSQETQAALSREFQSSERESRQEFELNKQSQEFALEQADQAIDEIRGIEDSLILNGYITKKAGQSEKFTKGLFELADLSRSNLESKKAEGIEFLSGLADYRDGLIKQRGRMNTLDKAMPSIFGDAMEFDADANRKMSAEEFQSFAEASIDPETGESLYTEEEFRYIQAEFTENGQQFGKEMDEEEKAQIELSVIRKNFERKSDLEITGEEKKQELLDAETAKLQLENITLLQNAEDTNNGILTGALVQSHGFNRRGGFRLPADDKKDSTATIWNGIARDTIETGSSKESVAGFKQNTVNMVLGVMRNDKLGNIPDFTKEQALAMLNAENPGAAVNEYRDKFYNSRLQPREVEKLTEVIEDYWNPMNGKSSVQAKERKATNDAIDAQRKKDSGGADDGNKDTATNALPDESSADFTKGRTEYNRILEAYNSSTDDVKAKLDENEDYKVLQEKYGDAEKADATFNSIVAREKESEPGSASSIASGIMSGKSASEAEAKVLKDSLFDAIKNFSWTPKESKSQKAKLAELEPAGQAEFKLSMDKAIAEFGPKPEMRAIQKKNSEERIEKYWKNQIQVLKRKQDSVNNATEKPNKGKYLDDQEKLIDEFGKHETVEERMAKTKELKSLSKEEISKREATKTDNLVADKNSSITREDAKALETKYDKLAKSKGDPVFDEIMKMVSENTDTQAADFLWKDSKVRAKLHAMRIKTKAEVKKLAEFTRRVKETDLMNWREVNAGHFTGVDRIDEKIMTAKRPKSQRVKELTDQEITDLARNKNIK